MKRNKTKPDILNKIIVGDTMKKIKEIPNNLVDLILISPPFDGANTPKEKIPDLSKLGVDFSRILKPGGVCIYHTQDLIINGLKSCTSLRVPLSWVDASGLNLWDDYIYNRGGLDGYWWKCRIRKDHDFLWIFVNEENKPKSFDKTGYEKQGSVFDYKTEKRQMRLSWLKKEKGKLYPVTWPFKLVSDMIRIFTMKGDTVLDCFCGFGTTLKAAKYLKRNYIGIELLPHVAKIAERNVNKGLIL